MTSSSSSKIALPAMMASVVVAAVANTIVRRIALVPMQRYPYFLTQLQTLTYVIFYTSVLCLRYRDGIVTSEMLKIRKLPFLYIGFWDSLGDTLGNVGTSRLPGYQVPLLAKLNIIFTAVFSSMLLGKRYTTLQMVAMAIVLCGSVVTLIPSITSSSSSSSAPSQQQSTTTADSTFSNLFYAGVYVASVAPTALAFVLKEQVFQANSQLNLDIFVVNSFGSMVGLFFTVALLPLAAVPGFGKVPLGQLPSYMTNGAYCFAGESSRIEGYACTGAPLAPLLYFAINLTYNIFFLNLIKHGGALLTFITNTVTFPLSTILFTLSWPLLGSSSLNIYIILGLCVELIGIVLYKRASSSAATAEQEQKEATRLLEHRDKDNNTYGSLVQQDGNCEESENVLQDYLEGEPPLCYNRCLRASIRSSCCNKEELCKCLLSPKCNCG